MWGHSNKILTKIRGVICNLFWCSKEQLVGTRVSWKECCMKKEHGGLVDPETTKIILLCKSIMKTMEPRESNLTHA